MSAGLCRDPYGGKGSQYSLDSLDGSREEIPGTTDSEGTQQEVSERGAGKRKLREGEGKKT